jgi:flagellar protein FlaG
MSIQLIAAVQGPPPVEALDRSLSDMARLKHSAIETDSLTEISEPSGEQLQDAIDTIQQAVNVATNELDFSIDEGSGRSVVKVIDKTTNEVIRQFPSKEVLEIAQALDKLQGLLIKEKA